MISNETVATERCNTHILAAAHDRYHVGITNLPGAAFFSLSPDNFLVVIPFKIAIYCNQKCWFLVELEPGSSDHRGVLKAMWLKLLNDVESRSNA